jgi:hypothetical protein
VHALYQPLYSNHFIPTTALISSYPPRTPPPLFPVRNNPTPSFKADVLFTMPVLRHVLALIGARPATKKLLTAALQSPPPHHVTFVLPGGIAEMFLSRPDIEHV